LFGGDENGKIMTEKSHENLGEKNGKSEFSSSIYISIALSLSYSAT
jgi:hypothetical protein